MTGRRVCATCCYECEYHFKWSGLWRCNFVTPEQRKVESMKRAQARFDEENRKISAAYHKRRKEIARERAIKAAKARKKH